MIRLIRKYFSFLALFSFLLIVIVLSVVQYKNYINEEITKLSTLNSLLAQSIESEVDRTVFIENIDKKISGVKIIYKDENEEYISENSGGNFTLGISSDNISLTKMKIQVVRELKDSALLGLSTTSNNFIGFVAENMPVHLLILGVLFIFTRFISQKLVITITEPLIEYEKKREIENISKFPELNSFLQSVDSKMVAKDNEVNDVKREIDTINTIINNMKEGLLILDSKRRILMINSEAVKLLETDKNSLGKSVLYITRSEELVRSLEQCYFGEYSEGKIEIQDKYIKFYANPVYYENIITGAVLLFIDETQRINAEKIREEFSANVSHELKTPLTSIYGFAELLSQNMVTDEKDRAEIIDRIYEEAKRLLTLIDEIIKISKLESVTQITEEEVDFKTLATSIYKHFAPIAKEKNIELKIDADGKFISNTTMIWELIANLLENAIKYNVENGRVEVEMKVGNEVEINISDTGIGIADEDLDRIFERFYRAEKSRNKKSGGTGLGLSIVKHIVKNLKGKIDIKSEVGKGTKIHVILPKNETY